MTNWVGACILLGIGALASAASVIVIFRTPLYYKIPKQQRPHRWIILSLAIVFLMFAVFFPLWLFFSNAVIRKIGLLLGMGPFLVWGIFFKVLSLFGVPGYLDSYIYRRWPDWTTER